MGLMAEADFSRYESREMPEGVTSDSLADSVGVNPQQSHHGR